MGPITPSGSSSTRPAAGGALPLSPGGPPGGGGWSKNPAARRSSNSSSFIAGMCRMCCCNAWSRRRRAPPLGAGGTNPGSAGLLGLGLGLGFPGTPPGTPRCPKMASKIPFSRFSRPNAALTTWSNNPRASAPRRRPPWPRWGLAGMRGACRAAALLCAAALSCIAFASFFCQCRTSFSAMSRSLSSVANALTSSRWPDSSNFSR
mmetsp:Transcript_6012/g.23108  ORF Transcript_6012/g.23108 Transcript_6012/m.23108 type:complete len:205 (-) Transcript_6012:782-1396(-)